MALLTTAWGEIDNKLDLIASNPVVYVGAAFSLVGVTMFALGGVKSETYEGGSMGLALDRRLYDPLMLALAGACLCGSLW